MEEWDFNNVDEKTVYPDYNKFADLTGLKLLDSTLSESNPYMQVMVETDKKDFAIIRVENYILGDTTNYQLVEDINRYNCDPGDKYKSSISLVVDLILSQEQLATGFDMEYLGYYEYLGTYKTADGMSVNMISEKAPNAPADLVSKKIAIFVRDGIKYTLAGSVSIDEMKHIVETMK